MVELIPLFHGTSVKSFMLLSRIKIFSVTLTISRLAGRKSIQGVEGLSHHEHWKRLAEEG
jgi:hypothetical protein